MTEKQIDPRILSDHQLERIHDQLAEVQRGVRTVPDALLMTWTDNLYGMVRALQEQNAALRTKYVLRYDLDGEYAVHFNSGDSWFRPYVSLSTEKIEDAFRFHTEADAEAKRTTLLMADNYSVVPYLPPENESKEDEPNV